MLVTDWNSQIENDDFEEFFGKPREKQQSNGGKIGQLCLQDNFPVRNFPVKLNLILGCSAG